MIFTEKRWDDGFLVVCGSLWPGADEGAPMPDGYPDRWRSGQPDFTDSPAATGRDAKATD